MPQLHNPDKVAYVLAGEVPIGAGETIDVTDDEAVLYVGHPIIEVVADVAPVKPAKAAPAVEKEK